MSKNKVSYDKIDPLENEKPFFISENGKVYQMIQENEKQFPFIHITLFAIAIPFIVFLMGIIYIGGLWNPVKKITELNYVIVSNDLGCYTPICNKMGLDENTKIGSFYNQLDGKGGHFTFLEGDKQTAIDLIENHDYWVALYIPEDFTSNILSNLNNINNSTLIPVEVDFIYDEARSYTTINFIKRAFKIMEKAFFNSLIDKIDENYYFNPFFLIEGIKYNDANLHPIHYFGQNSSTFIFLVIIWIGTIMISIFFHFYYPLEDHWLYKENKKHPIAKTMIAKIFLSSFVMIVIDSICSVIPYFCAGEFEIQKGHGAFLCLIILFSLIGLSVNNLLIHIHSFIFFYTIAVTFMFLQLLSCGGFVEHDVQYKFYSIGKVLPMYYGVKEIKYIYWNSGKHYQKKNFLMLAFWLYFTSTTSLFMYYLEIKVKRRKWLKSVEKQRKYDFINKN